MEFCQQKEPSTTQERSIYKKGFITQEKGSLLALQVAAVHLPHPFIHIHLTMYHQAIVTSLLHRFTALRFDITWFVCANLIISLFI